MSVRAGAHPASYKGVLTQGEPFFFVRSSGYVSSPHTRENHGSILCVGVLLLKASVEMLLSFVFCFGARAGGDGFSIE